MSDPAAYAIFAVSAVSLISLTGLFLLPGRIERMHMALLALVGLAVGALIGDAFIHLLPEAWDELGERAVPWVLAGMATFFVLEKFLHWHHHHHVHEGMRDGCDDCEHHVAPFGKMIILSDALHNVIDGAIIGAGFLVSTEVGIATTAAVVLHEIPQEIGDFGALLHAGFSRRNALLVNFASALSAFAGLALVLILGSVEGAIPVLSALTAGVFIYIAAVDLVPELHKAPSAKDSVTQLVAIALGVCAMFALTALEDGIFRRFLAGEIIGTEGPTMITIEAYQNDLDTYSTETWVRGHGGSNFKL